MNLVVLQGNRKAPAVLKGSEEETYINLFWGMFDNIEYTSATADILFNFGEHLVNTLSLYSAKGVFKMWDLNGYGVTGDEDLNQVEDLAFALFMLRSAILLRPGDVQFAAAGEAVNMLNKGYYYNPQGKLAAYVKENSILLAILRDIQTNKRGYGYKMPQLANLALDMAYRFYVGFYEYVPARNLAESALWKVTKGSDYVPSTTGDGIGFLRVHHRETAFLEYIMGWKGDELLKELERAKTKYNSTKKDSYEATLMNKAAEQVEQIRDKVIDTVSQTFYDNTFKIVGTAVAFGSVLPLMAWLGIKPKDKALLWSGVALAAIPLAIGQRFVWTYRAGTRTKLIFAPPAMLIAGLGGFWLGRGMKTIVPFAVAPAASWGVGVGKRVIEKKVGL